MKTIFYFTAEWCFPCKQTRPVVEQFIRETPDTTLVIIDVDAEIEIAQELDIMQVPTFILFEDEKEIKRMYGQSDRKRFEEFVNG